MEISKLIKERILNKEYNYIDLLDIIMDSLDGQDEVIIDYMENRDYFIEYGYTQELKERIAYLEEENKKIPENLPKLDNLQDLMKYNYFMENFDNINLNN